MVTLTLKILMSIKIDQQEASCWQTYPSLKEVEEDHQLTTTNQEEQTGKKWTETDIVIKKEIEMDIETAEIEPEVAETKSGTETVIMIGREIKTGEKNEGARMVRNDATRKTKTRNGIRKTRKIPLVYLTFLLLAVKC